MQFSKARIRYTLNAWENAKIVIESKRLILRIHLDEEYIDTAITEVSDYKMEDINFKLAQIHAIMSREGPYLEVYRELFMHPLVSMEVIESTLMNKLKTIRHERVRLLKSMGA